MSTLQLNVLLLFCMHASAAVRQTDVMCTYAQAIIIRLWLMYARKTMRFQLKGERKKNSTFSFSFETIMKNIR